METITSQTYKMISRCYSGTQHQSADQSAVT